ncbi:MAG TPA: roadblock/LC7 domain-containing protein [Candidatus Obscuribacterales bacterium]
MNDKQNRLLIQKQFDVPLTDREKRTLELCISTDDSAARFHRHLKTVIDAFSDLELPEAVSPSNPDRLAREILNHLPPARQSLWRELACLLAKPFLHRQVYSTGRITQVRNGTPDTVPASISGHALKYPAEATNASNQSSTASRLNQLSAENQSMSGVHKLANGSLGQRLGMQPTAETSQPETLTLAEAIRRKIRESHESQNELAPIASPLGVEDGLPAHSSTGAEKARAIKETAVNCSVPRDYPQDVPVQQSLAAQIQEGHPTDVRSVKLSHSAYLTVSPPSPHTDAAPSDNYSKSRPSNDAQPVETSQQMIPHLFAPEQHRGIHHILTTNAEPSQQASRTAESKCCDEPFFWPPLPSPSSPDKQTSSESTDVASASGPSSSVLPIDSILDRINSLFCDGRQSSQYQNAPPVKTSTAPQSERAHSNQLHPASEAGQYEGNFPPTIQPVARKSADPELRQEARVSRACFPSLARIRQEQPTSPSEHQGKISSVGKFLLDSQTSQSVSQLISSGFSESKFRVISLEIAKQLQEALEPIEMCNGVIGSLVVGYDGMLIASTLPQDLDTESLGTGALVTYMNSQNILWDLRQDKIQQLISKTPCGYTIFSDFGRGILVTLTESSDSNCLIPLLSNIREICAH